MSRLATKPIKLPPKTEATYSAGVFTVKGPLGSLTRDFRPHVGVAVADGAVTVTLVRDNLEGRALVGTYAAHIKNMLAGVNKPYEKKLIIEGIGFKADVKGKDLVLNVGFSHPVSLPIPSDLKVTVDKSGISVSGMDIEKVGKLAAEIRAVKKPEPYLGKGIRYSDEVIRRKQGKKAA